MPPRVLAMLLRLFSFFLNISDFNRIHKSLNELKEYYNLAIQEKDTNSIDYLLKDSLDLPIELES